MESSGYEWMLQGYYYYYTPGDGKFTAEQNGRNGVTVRFNGTGPIAAGHYWSIWFSVPNNVPLTVGTYDGAIGFNDPNQRTDVPRLNVVGEGRDGYDAVKGNFTIQEIAYSLDNTIEKFHATFTETVTGLPNGQAPIPFTGEVLYNSSAPLPPNHSSLHPPEELLYVNEVSSITIYDPSSPNYPPSRIGSSGYGFAFDQRGCFYYGGPLPSSPDDTRGFLQRYSPDSKQVTDIPGFEKTFPTRLVCDRAGNLFVAQHDKVSKSLVKVTPSGTVIPLADDVGDIKAMVCDAAGNLFVSDHTANAIYKFDLYGQRTTFFEGFVNLSTIGFDAKGNLLAWDGYYKTFFRISPAGSFSNFAGGFVEPRSLALNRKGELFVADLDFHQVTFPDGSFTYHGGYVYKLSEDGTKTQIVDVPGGPADIAYQPQAPVVPVNISTRAYVGADQNVLISGFIVSGEGPKKLMIRGIGPSLANAGIAHPLQDPVLTLHDSSGNVVAVNDNWADTQAQQISSSGLAPIDSHESAILTTLQKGAYTAVLSGKDNSAGVGLVEVYDLAPYNIAQLANISTRSLVESGDNVMIAGFILTSGQLNSKVVVRAIGPSLANQGIGQPLTDPILELHDKDGLVVANNDDWQQSQPSELQQIGLAPADPRESALIANLGPGLYTAIVRDKNGTAGVGVVEVYDVN